MQCGVVLTRRPDTWRGHPLCPSQILDHYFGNVCELDLVFGFHKVGGRLRSRQGCAEFLETWTCLLAAGCWQQQHNKAVRQQRADAPPSLAARAQSSGA